MFKILVLKPDIDDKLQEIAADHDILAVTLLGQASDFTQYVLVQYGTKLPDGSTRSAKK
jgi:hypothetical protein